MKNNELFTPQRQSVVAIILILLKFVRLIVRQLWPLLLILLINRKSDLQTWIGLVFGVVAMLSLVGSIIAYFKFYYFISNHHLNLHKGVLRRVKLNIPFERIQTIDFEQNLVHQVFGVVRVKIDTAGSKAEEISFDALQRHRAEQLRDYILEQKAELVQEAVQQELMPPEPRELILRLSPVDLLKIGVSQNHLRTAGIIFAFFLATADDLSDVLKNIDVVDWMSREAAVLIRGSFILALLAIPVFLLISFFVTLVRTVFVHYDLRFWKTAHGFKLNSGLITRHEKSAQKHKIQLIEWDTNPIRKLFGIFRLHLYQASSVSVIGGNKAMTVPGCYQGHIERVIASVIPGSSGVEYETHHIHPLARTRFILFAGLLPCLLLSAFGYFTHRDIAVWIWLYFPVSIWMGQLYFRKRQLALHPDYAIVKGGIIGTDWKMLELYKVQAVKVSQSFFQLRRHLASVTLYTASGAVKFPYIPYAKASQLRDYILYRVERDRRKWM